MSNDECPKCGATVTAPSTGLRPPMREPDEQTVECPECGTPLRRAVGDAWEADTRRGRRLQTPREPWRTLSTRQLVAPHLRPRLSQRFTAHDLRRRSAVAGGGRGRAGGDQAHDG